MANDPIKKKSLDLPAEVSDEIWQKTLEQSAVLTLGREMPMGGNGEAIHVVTGDPTAKWVGEGEKKPVNNGTAELKLLTPYKVAVIEVFSQEILDDDNALYQAMVNRLPYSIGATVDNTVMGGTIAPGEHFDTLANSPAVDIKTDAWNGLVTADTTIATSGYVLSGFGVSPQGKSVLLSAVDSNKRPLFVNSAAEGAIPQILGVPASVHKALYVKGTPNVIGVAGDFSQLVYGYAKGITVKVSDQATVTDGENTYNLFQDNMVAVLVEARIGVGIGDKNAFVRLTDGAAA